MTDPTRPRLDPPDLPPETPAFWAHFWTHGVTPWDIGRAHPVLDDEADALADGLATRDAFVPGAGRGHDALRLADAGWRVTAVDFSPEAASCVAHALSALGGTFLVRDVFDVDVSAGFDLWWEHTFLSALPPTHHRAWADTAARAVRPGGRLAALLFPTDKPAADGGPPYRVDLPLVDRLLDGTFTRERDRPVAAGTGHRSFGQHYGVWRRT